MLLLRIGRGVLEGIFADAFWGGGFGGARGDWEMRGWEGSERSRWWCGCRRRVCPTHTMGSWLLESCLALGGELEKLMGLPVPLYSFLNHDIVVFAFVLFQFSNGRKGGGVVGPS